MKQILTIALIFCLNAIGISQTIEEAEQYYRQDSSQMALKVLNQLDQNDKEVQKLYKKVEKLIKWEKQQEEIKEAKYTKVFGGVPTANKNMKWDNNLTPEEKYSGVINVDSTIDASKIIDAFIATFQPLQDANIMTKQMRTNNAIGGVSSAVSGDYRSMKEFSEAGSADARNQYKGSSTWTVQFIDGVQLTRFYFNINVQAKDGRYKITVIPSGISGYGNNHIQTEWSQLFKDGEVKAIYANTYYLIKTKLAYTIDQWITDVEEHLKANATDDW